MKKQKQNWYIGAGIIIVIILIAAIYGMNQKNEIPIEQTSNKTTTQKTTNSNTSTSKSWTGFLQKSDNTAKGNLMLTNSGPTVYINTTRDFSALVGKQVMVTYTGNANDFTLVSIVAK